jgi:hypothetical protein
MHVMPAALVAVVTFAVGLSTVHAQEDRMGFFITSEGPGSGGDLGGLEGADDHCQQLADAVGAGGRTWRAYLSSSKQHARDRIGNGPWYNASGELIAANLDALHGPANRLDKETGLTESGDVVNGSGDTPNMHDILTGSDSNGRYYAGHTCADWTSSEAGSAVVGHHDRIGLSEDAPSKSWNSSHVSRGCSLEMLRATGGNGLFYCFAAD